MEQCVFRKRESVRTCMHWCRCNELERNPQSSFEFRRVCHIPSAMIRRKRGRRGWERRKEEGGRGEIGSILRDRKSSNAELARKVLAHARFIRGCNARLTSKRQGWLYHTLFSPSLFVPSCAADILLTFDQEIHGESVVKRFAPRACNPPKKFNRLIFGL